MTFGKRLMYILNSHHSSDLLIKGRVRRLNEALGKIVILAYLNLISIVDHHYFVTYIYLDLLPHKPIV